MSGAIAGEIEPNRSQRDGRDRRLSCRRRGASGDASIAGPAVTPGCA
jgi:hypothetical protein